LREQLLQIICASGIKRIFFHIEEYRADSFAIKQLKKEPQTLVKLAKQQLLQQVYESTYKSSSVFAATVKHWLHDTHGSYIGRANRFLKGADIKTSQTELMAELNRQSETYLKAYHQQSPPFRFDMAPILAASETNKALAAESEKRAEELREFLTIGSFTD
jgi:hypothetical protein